MPPKNDFIVWLSMHPFQRVLYTVRTLVLRNLRPHHMRAATGSNGDL